MACLKGIRSYEESVFQSLFVRCFERTEIPNIIWRLLGTQAGVGWQGQEGVVSPTVGHLQVGRGAYISQSDDPPLMAWDMMSIGENAILDGTNVLDASRTFHMNQRLSIGNDAAARLKDGSESPSRLCFARASPCSVHVGTMTHFALNGPWPTPTIKFTMIHTVLPQQVICANAIIKGGATVGDGAVVLPNTTLAGAPEGVVFVSYVTAILFFFFFASMV